MLRYNAISEHKKIGFQWNWQSGGTFRGTFNLVAAAAWIALDPGNQSAVALGASRRLLTSTL